jgi:hypothetical protein
MSAWPDGWGVDLGFHLAGTSPLRPGRLRTADNKADGKAAATTEKER